MLQEFEMLQEFDKLLDSGIVISKSKTNLYDQDAEMQWLVYAKKLYSFFNQFVQITIIQRFKAIKMVVMLKISTKLE